MKFYIGKTALAIFWGCIKRYVAAVMATKADKAETLAGYGIKDAYKKTDVDKMIEEAKMQEAPSTGDADNGFVGVIDVEIDSNYDPVTGNKNITSISNVDDIITKGMYRLRTQLADSILNVESLTEDYIIQYVLVGGLMGTNSDKFVYRTLSNGVWTEWMSYDFLNKKQDNLASGESISIRIGQTFLHLTEPKLKKLKSFLEEE